MSACRHKAFTLVEMLVVIAIIGVLAALLVPAIQAARAAARRAHCVRNLEQCATAAITYATDKGQLPASRTYKVLNGNAEILNWVYPILPNLDQDSIHKGIMTGSINLSSPTGLPEIEVLFCPSQTRFDIDELGTYPAGFKLTKLSYIVNGGRQNSNGSGSNPLNFDYLANGVFVDAVPPPPATAWPPPNWPGKHKCRIADIHDGRSNTLMISETVNAQSWVTAPLQQHSQMLWFPEDPNTFAGFIGLNQDKRASYSTVDANPRYARPSSMHSGGFNVAMCDESVHFFAETVDYRVYAVLMTSNGAKAADPSQPLASQTLPNPVWQHPHSLPCPPNVPYPGTEF